MAVQDIAKVVSGDGEIRGGSGLRCRMDGGWGRRGLYIPEGADGEFWRGMNGAMNGPSGG